MKREDIVEQLIGNNKFTPYIEKSTAFAPANIALCKYWGKRDSGLNLPVTSSLSISLGSRGTETTLSVIDEKEDRIILNGEEIQAETEFAKRITEFLNLFRRDNKIHFLVKTNNNIPTKAGIASSASGFAALTLALNKLFHFELDNKSLSILARLGSGSAARSLFRGFVKWHKGEREDGMDSYAQSLNDSWPNLRVGLLIVSMAEKPIGSREAMHRTVETSPYYKHWPQKVADDMKVIEEAIYRKEFGLFGQAAESNALAMHASMLAAQPPVLYFQPKTIEYIQQIWQLRQEGLSLYFTQDAGPNLKLLFLKRDEEKVKENFENLELVNPFEESEEA